MLYKSGANVFTLFVEELRSAFRGRFAWFGVAVVLFGLGALATVATQDTWLDGYGIVAYFLVPICFIPLTAGFIAAPRANRFVESVFTAPVERRDWFIAKILVVVVLAAAYYLALVPMMAVYVAYVGMPFLLEKFVEWTPGILIISIAVGSLIGVMFIGRSVAPPIATSVGVLLLFAVLVPLQELLVARGYGAMVTSHLTLSDPLVLLKNGLGFTLAAGFVPGRTALTWLSLGSLVIGLTALSAWIFLRAQGVESWEASKGQRCVIAVAIAALFGLPMVLADSNYDAPVPAPNNVPSIPGLFLRGGGTLALVDPQGPQPTRCCGTLLNRDQWPSLPTGERTAQDLLLLLPVSSTEKVEAIDIAVAGQNGLRVDVSPGDRAQALTKLETRDYPAGSGPGLGDGQHISTGWVARLPITLFPTNPWDVGGVRYPIDVTAHYRLAGDSQDRVLATRAAVEAHVPQALLAMAAASAGLPLLCLLMAFNRRRRTS